MNLSIKNLSKSFGKKTIFKDFSYEFSSTGICLISGDSGIGKTTAKYQTAVSVTFPLHFKNTDSSPTSTPSRT